MFPTLLWSFPVGAGVTAEPGAGQLLLAGFAPTVFVGQLAVPVSVVSIGGWTDEGGGVTDIWQSIDEGWAVNDADYVRSIVEPVDDELVVGLTALSVPQVGTVTVHVRHGTL